MLLLVLIYTKLIIKFKSTMFGINKKASNREYCAKLYGIWLGVKYDPRYQIPQTSPKIIEEPINPNLTNNLSMAYPLHPASWLSILNIKLATSI